jgi:rhamnose transport system permease protein
VISGGRQVDPNDVPLALIHLVKPSPIRVQWLVLIAAVIVIAVAIFLRRTRMGREIYAVGSNPEAARLRGIPVRRITLLVFAVSGMLSGAAGVMYASRFGFVNPGQTGVGFELQVIAATVIGGANIFGGSGTALGTVIGCLFLVVINNGLTVMGVSGFWQLAVYGVMILLALILDAEVRRRLERPATRGGAA